MLGLMQDHPLELSTVLRHAERMHPTKPITSRGPQGLVSTPFREVMQRTRRLMSALRELGVAPGDRVATFCWNHQPHLEAYLGVPCLGAVLHTLNIRLFPADLAWIVDHAQDQLLIVDQSLLPQWEQVAARLGPASPVRQLIVVRDLGEGPLPAGALDYEQLLAEAAPLEELPRVGETRAAAMCYTSGTTGNPKGVVYSHRSNLLHSLVVLSGDALGIRERDVVLPIVPMFHANAWGLPYACLLAGAEMVLPGRDLTPPALLEALITRRVTLAAGVPSIWTAMLEPLAAARERLCVERILCGGSAVPLALQAAYRERVGAPIVQAWGMTETSPMGTLCQPLSAHDALPGPALAAVLNTQGRPVPLVELRIVGEDGQELPWDGEAVGEVEVRGPWVASGYYREPPGDERFRAGWLRTGDVAAVCPQGYLRICDRTKDLVKSGGEWISSVALESHLMAHPQVAEAAVIAVLSERWGERPLACVVPRPEARATLTEAALLEFLRPRVARWWLPDQVVFVDEVPKTSVGKFDKKALRARFAGHVLPACPREKV